MERNIVIGKYTLESLTNGMYSDPLDLYREYIQNAVDSIDSARQQGEGDEQSYSIQIQVDKLAGTISIQDNGRGIPSGSAAQTLVDIGNSEKDKRKMRGFRGIGRLAGLGYSDELIFSTSFQGEGVKTIVSFDTCLLRKLLFSKNESVVSINDVMRKIVKIHVETEQEQAHYFTVELNGVPIKEKLLDEEEVENYLIQHAPLPFNKNFVWASTIKEKSRILGVEIPEYRIELNGHQLFKPYENTFVCDRVKKREDSIYDIEVIPFYREGKLSAILWYGVIGFYGTILNNQIKGLRIRQGNLLIGDKSTCNMIFKEERFNGWMIGELHVVDSDLVVNARRDYFEQNEAHYDLSESFKEWSASKVREIRKLSYQRTLSERKIAIIEAEDTKEVSGLLNEEIGAYGEGDYIDREETEEVSEIDFMDKLSWLLNQKQGKTKYMVLNVNNHLTNEQKKTLEQVFDIVKVQYCKEEAEKFINIIVDNI